KALDVRCEKNRIVFGQFRISKVRGELRILDKFCGRIFALSSELIRDLVCAALLLKELALCFENAPFRIRRAIWIKKNSIDQSRILNKQLLIERDELKHWPDRRRLRKIDYRFGGRCRVDDQRFVKRVRQSGAVNEM